MKTARLLALLAFAGALIALPGCSKSSTPAAPVSQVVVRNYSGTASVGDFLTISINSATQTITYRNYSNGDAGSLPYTVNANGTYAIADPNGNLVAAYQVPGSELLVETNKSGPNHNTPALVTAIESAPASINTFATESFNYIQFRTAAGGVELGTITIDAHGNIEHDGYWPYGALSQPPNSFNGGDFPATSVVEDPSGNFFTVNEGNGESSTAFGTQNGLFVVDTGNGTILALPKASSKSFSASHAGTYTAILYEKSNATTGQGNVETGTIAEGNASVTVTAGGLMTITDSQSHTLATGTLTAIADTPYLYDHTANTLSDPCNGMFTFRTTTANSQQDLFVTFQGNAVIFSSFQAALPIQAYAPYTYFYGVGVS